MAYPDIPFPRFLAFLGQDQARDWRAPPRQAQTAPLLMLPEEILLQIIDEFYQSLTVEIAVTQIKREIPLDRKQNFATDLEYRPAELICKKDRFCQALNQTCYRLRHLVQVELGRLKVEPAFTINATHRATLQEVQRDYVPFNWSLLSRIRYLTIDTSFVKPDQIIRNIVHRFSEEFPKESLKHLEFYRSLKDASKVEYGHEPILTDVLSEKSRTLDVYPWDDEWVRYLKGIIAGYQGRPPRTCRLTAKVVVQHGENSTIETIMSFGPLPDEQGEEYDFKPVSFIHVDGKYVVRREGRLLRECELLVRPFIPGATNDFTRADFDERSAKVLANLPVASDKSDLVSKEFKYQYTHAVIPHT